ncbi:PREDICTED: probable C-_U-editing enzyme APOBEC-2 [Thamnophis sirtalis]|uniref:mRNA(cytosine(6666)) deaminase n=1 Tax=Thamnophis sirtalis TaxID=35019 RepID=A0A6I9XCP9_9SAUR|nr:PREDICTED: probable C->U-editing enzyme APOBEC-2 [Thamnophis sirtalis]XP_013912037.1 PREDICTED: probable C->U-editing enzyme APOBEC-2 [Thamnophis sirtalis]XP_032074456.1 C->U-editing enzyme APOBEC-2 [Thamnophis elegans]
MAEKQEQPPVAQNGEKAENAENAEESAEGEKPKELEELPPFEIVTGERLPACFFNFQFKNVEYSSGRNKTFLCYIIEIQGKESKILRGYLEDEHAAAHAEDAFFNTILPKCESGLRYSVTWYASCSPCVGCADRIVKALQKNKNLHLSIAVGRLFMWEEPDIQAALKKMKTAGCKLRIMKPQDFEYVWQNFVEQEEEEEAKKAFTPWEDIQENFQFYDEKLGELLH